MNEDDEMRQLTIKEAMISEEIQTELAPIITEYLTHKRALLDALDWIQSVIYNDYKNGLNVYESSFEKPPKEDEEYIDSLKDLYNAAKEGENK